MCQLWRDDSMATKFWQVVSPKFGVYHCLIFSFHDIFAFYERLLPKSIQFCILIFFRFFQIKFENFLTFLNNLQIQDGGFYFGVVWRHNWHVTVTEINIFGCFTHHISLIFIAWILFEIHRRGRGGTFSSPPSHELKVSPSPHRVKYPNV